MKAQHHVMASVALSTALQAIWGSWALSLSSLAAGILTDIDHIFDVFAEYGPVFSFRRFSEACYQRTLQRAFLLLHGWEYAGLLLGIAWFTAWHPIATGVLIGYGQHMILDQVGNRPAACGYWLLWRMRRGFLMEKMFPRDKTENSNPPAA